MNQYIYVRPRYDGQGWAVDVYDGRRAWARTHIGERHETDHGCICYDPAMGAK